MKFFLFLVFLLFLTFATIEAKKKHHAHRRRHRHHVAGGSQSNSTSISTDCYGQISRDLPRNSNSLDKISPVLTYDIEYTPFCFPSKLEKNVRLKHPIGDSICPGAANGSDLIVYWKPNLVFPSGPVENWWITVDSETTAFTSNDVQISMFNCDYQDLLTSCMPGQSYSYGAVVNKQSLLIQISTLQPGQFGDIKVCIWGSDPGVRR